jgi:adenylyltransferase/sulfurtransferase
VSGNHEPPISLTEGRFARLEAIEWWDQSLLRRSKVLVVGAGALGNEVLKNLALLGLGNVVVVDMDTIEASNLSRSILFRKSDEGSPKAERAASGAKSIFPGMNITPITGNVMADVGLGYFRWADVIIGALDNREARVFLNSACAQTGKAWIDGGIDVLSGIVRGFAPKETACYECTMGKADWDLLNKRRSCSLLGRRALDQGGVPTTPTIASIIGAVQVQEMIKILHGMDALLGKGIVFDGVNHDSYTVSYSRKPDCVWHEVAPDIEQLTDLDHETKVGDLWERAEGLLGGLDAIDFAREIVERIECAECGISEDVLRPAEHIREDQIICPGCGKESTPVFFHGIGAGSGHMVRTLREIGLPRWDIVWARHGERCIGLEISGDDPFGQDHSGKQD